MQGLKDFIRDNLDKAEMWKNCLKDEDQRFYQGKIIAYRNIMKYIKDNQKTEK